MVLSLITQDIKSSKFTLPFLSLYLMTMALKALLLSFIPIFNKKYNLIGHIKQILYINTFN